VNLAEITTEKPTTGSEVAPGSENLEENREIIDAKKNTMTMAEAVRNTSTVPGNLAREEKVNREEKVIRDEKVNRDQNDPNDPNEGKTLNAEEQNGQAKRIWNHAKDPDTDAIISTLQTPTVIFFSFLLMYIM